MCVMSAFSSKVVFNVSDKASVLNGNFACHMVFCVVGSFVTHTHLFNLCNQQLS